MPSAIIHPYDDNYNSIDDRQVVRTPPQAHLPLNPARSPNHRFFWSSFQTLIDGPRLVFLSTSYGINWSQTTSVRNLISLRWKPSRVTSIGLCYWPKFCHRWCFLLSHLSLQTSIWRWKLSWRVQRGRRHSKYWMMVQGMSGSENISMIWRIDQLSKGDFLRGL